MEEKWASCFAANLLMPTEPFRSAINSRMRGDSIAFESLFDVAREFDVSIDSVIWRMHFVYGRRQSESQRTKTDLDRAKQLISILEEREDSKPHPWPARYRALAIRALRRGEMSIGRFAEYLNISRHEAMRFAEQDVPGSEEIQVAPA